MDKNVTLIQRVQKRVAELSIGPSTLRRQGSGEMPKEARKFLRELPLRALADMDSEQYMVWLNKHTDGLVQKFLKIEPKRNWGAAREAINIFLENAFYNRFLYAEYSLRKIERFLELPFDSNTVAGLRKDIDLYKIKQGVLPKWDTIIHLEPTDHEVFQDYATRVAEKKLKSIKHKSRIYLDLYYWRTNNNGT